jgi:uncharacterized protein with HEPN domain
MRDNRERLLDIQEAIANIEKYASRGREAFDHDELIQTWIMHHIQTIGEAVRGLTDEFRAQHPEVVWEDIVGMRNIIIHRYFGIDLKAVWSVAETDIPILKEKIEKMLGEMKEDKEEEGEEET